MAERTQYMFKVETRDGMALFVNKYLADKFCDMLNKEGKGAVVSNFTWEVSIEP